MINSNLTKTELEFELYKTAIDMKNQAGCISIYYPELLNQRVIKRLISYANKYDTILDMLHAKNKEV